MLLFIDFEKAFDAIDHDFIFAILKALNFPPHFIDLIKLGFKDTSCQLIINGYLTDSIPMPGGGRQGDCLFPLIFAIVVMTIDVLMDDDPLFIGLPLPLSDSYVKVKQYADDTTPCISSINDYIRCRTHLTTFCKASGSIINWDKSAALLLGNWIADPPNKHPPHTLQFPELATDQITIIKNNEAFRVLGILLGITSSPYASITKAISKISAYLESRNQRTLNTNGAILISNACIMGRAVFPILYSPYTSSHTRAINSITNRFTNNDKNRGYFSFEEKVRTRKKGGPTTPLINGVHFFSTLHASHIDEIITSNIELDWHYFWINELYVFLNRHRLSNINQLFISNLLPKSITKKSTIQSLTLQSYKAWKNMDYTYQIPPDPSYDELSIQPIWYNPSITYNEDTFSPPPGFSSNSLNTIACLCSNFNDETSAVSAGHWYNVHELALNYPNNSLGTRGTKTFFRRLTRAIPLKWKRILMQGNQQFKEGEWVSAGITDNNIPIQQWDIYRISIKNHLQHLTLYTIEDNPPYLTLHINSCAPWGSSPILGVDNPLDGDYPLKSQVRRVHVIDETLKGVTNHKLIGYYTFKIPPIHHCFSFGILKNRFKTIHSEDFKTAAKNYRHSHASINPYLINWPNHNQIDWKKKLKQLISLSHTPK